MTDLTRQEFADALQAQLTDVQTLREDADRRGWTTEVDRHEHLIERLQEHLGRIDIERTPQAHTS